MNSTETRLAEIRGQRDEIRSAAIAYAESDDFDPDSREFKDLETRTGELDRRAAALARLLDEQAAADKLDGILSKATKQAKDKQQQQGQQQALQDRLQTRSLPPLTPNWDELQRAAQAIESGHQDRVRIQYQGLQTRALVTSTDTGGAVADLSATIPTPRRLSAAVGLTAQTIGARGASGPQYGPMTALPPTPEGSVKPEADDISEVELKPGAFARWTELTTQASMSAPLAEVSAWHSIGLALDEDKMIIDALTAEAGAAIPGTGDVAADLRSAAAVVSAQVASDADVIVVNPADVGKITGTTPGNAADLAVQANTLGGALIYPSNSQPAGTAIVAALRASGRYGVARATSMLVELNVRENKVTVLTELFAGFAVQLAGGVAAVGLTDTTP